MFDRTIINSQRWNQKMKFIPQQLRVIFYFFRMELRPSLGFSVRIVSPPYFMSEKIVLFALQRLSKYTYSTNGAQPQTFMKKKKNEATTNIYAWEFSQLILDALTSFRIPVFYVMTGNFYFIENKKKYGSFVCKTYHQS